MGNWLWYPTLFLISWDDPGKTRLWRVVVRVLNGELPDCLNQQGGKSTRLNWLL